MQRIYSIAIIAAGFIFLIGAAVVISDNIHKKNAEAVVVQTDTVKDLAADIIWNAYSMQGGLFIYPADWTLTETKTEVKKKMTVTSFRVASADGAHAISATLGCANADADATTNTDCIKGFLLRAEDETPLTLAVYAHMKAFVENPEGQVSSGEVQKK